MIIISKNINFFVKKCLKRYFQATDYNLEIYEKLKKYKLKLSSNSSFSTPLIPFYSSKDVDTNDIIFSQHHQKVLLQKILCLYKTIVAVQEKELLLEIIFNNTATFEAYLEATKLLTAGIALNLFFLFAYFLFLSNKKLNFVIDHKGNSPLSFYFL